MSDRLPAVNDPLTAHAVGAGVWGDPSHPDTEQDAVLGPQLYDYSAGMFVGLDDQASAVPIVDPTLLRVGVQTELRSFQAPHEATHRRFEPPFTVGIGQAAAGYTLLAPSRGLQYIKILGCWINLSAAGTLRFTEGAGLATDPGIGGVGEQMGHVPVGTTGGFVLNMAEPSDPHLFTSPDQSLGLFTATGLAAGWVTLCYSNYDQ